MFDGSSSSYHRVSDYYKVGAKNVQFLLFWKRNNFTRKFSRMRLSRTSEFMALSQEYTHSGVVSVPWTSALSSALPVHRVRGHMNNNLAVLSCIFCHWFLISDRPCQCTLSPFQRLSFISLQSLLRSCELLRLINLVSLVKPARSRSRSRSAFFIY